MNAENLIKILNFKEINCMQIPKKNTKTEFLIKKFLLFNLSLLIKNICFFFQSGQFLKIRLFLFRHSTCKSYTYLLLAHIEWGIHTRYTNGVRRQAFQQKHRKGLSLHYIKAYHLHVKWLKLKLFPTKLSNFSSSKCFSLHEN